MFRLPACRGKRYLRTSRWQRCNLYASNTLFSQYCGPACQRSDWRDHKPVCKIMQIYKEFPDVRIPLGVSKANFHANVKKFNALEQAANGDDESFAGVLPRNTNPKSWRMARKLIMASPCCAICQKTDYDRDLTAPIEWKCCPRCKYGWTCAVHHQEYMTSRHTDEICANYIRHSKIELFRYNHTINEGDRFMFMSGEVLSAPMRSFPRSWDEYFRIRCSTEYSMRRRLPEEFFPAATFLLSQVNTILYGMYLHGKDQFTSLEELTIHVLGPSENFEYEGGAPTCIWEEIMHCLPSVKTLKVIMVGPEGKLNFPLTQIEACPNCNANGRVRMQGFYDMTYHDYRASDDFVKPDFVAAYNTGMYDEYTESWKESLGVLLDLDVPCIFTSYNEEEGQADLRVIKGVGANTLSNQTTLNPFHVQIPVIDDNYIDKFFYDSMYYVCFRGREN